MITPKSPIAPLAEQMRPASIEEIVGQEHLIGPEGFITKIISAGRPLSIILWGPPGCGKTSIARLYAKAFNIPFYSMSAIFNGITDLKKLIEEIENTPLLHQRAVLFVDEIHRFNKAQQDAFLPYVEKGTIVLIGATAENPSFHLNTALLSRLRVLSLQPLNEKSLHHLLQRYEARKKVLPLTDEARQLLILSAQGDGRFLLNLIENLQGVNENIVLDADTLQTYLQQRTARYDRQGDQHYHLISALHKAVRGSDPDAALYWLARMLEGKEDPLFLARRIIRMASEDIGLADPQALPLCIAARNTYEMLGSPEGELALAQAVVYLALAPKSNALYKAYEEAKQLAAQTTHMDPPPIILNASTPLMKQMGYGKNYLYDHELEHAFSGQNYFPEELPPRKFYCPVERGFEREMKKRQSYFDKLRIIKKNK
jgi:putative ATPase